MKTNDSEQIMTQLFRKHRAEIMQPMPRALKNEILENLFPTAKQSVGFFSWMAFAAGALATCLMLIVAFQIGRSSAGGTGDAVVAQEVVSSHVRSLMAQHLY